MDLHEARDDGVLTWHLGCSGISWTICKQSAPHTSGGQTDGQTDCLHCLLLVLMTVSNKVWLARTTHRHIHTQAGRQIHREIGRDIHIDRQRDRHIHTNRQRYTQTERQTDIHTEIQTYKQADTQTDRQTDRQLTLSRAGDDDGELLRLSVTESGVPGRQERNGFRRVGQ